MFRCVPARLIGLLSLSLWLSACASAPELTSFGNTVSPEINTAVEMPENENLVPTAQAQFRAGNYGKAAQLYLKATELFPNSAEAWLGLAASFDRLRRFDEAGKAYARLYKLIGGSATYYNNVGYSYLLRGDLKQARENLMRAYDLDPDNVAVRNNLALLTKATR